MWCIKEVIIMQILNLTETQGRTCSLKYAYLAMSYLATNKLKLQSELLSNTTCITNKQIAIP
jgi:hypothetical protein